MADLKEQCVCIELYFKLVRNAVEIFQVLKISLWNTVNGNNIVFEWFSKFRSGVTSVENAKHLGCPSMSKTDENVDQVKKLVLENRKIVICEGANVLGIRSGSVQSIWKTI
jgi:hypothetical protein